MPSVYCLCVCTELAVIGLTVSAEQWQTTLNLLAMLLVMQLWMLLVISATRTHCQILPTLLPSGSPGYFPQSCAPALLPEALQGFITSQLQDFEFFFAEFHAVPVGHFYSL